ncbi:hypothetical protein B0A48_03798 [Cryoendolithus antarcticus]|uniref:Uncharacterized protein n=1 Tax=Cryoendolithus antarcticus TaxID=1507870 RepID=A0A1V8TGX9_9PEZI|nr:hypothetical protein B0A48_03798 [Cryoendolithus antarcticus]
MLGVDNARREGGVKPLSKPYNLTGVLMGYMTAFDRWEIGGVEGGRLPMAPDSNFDDLMKQIQCYLDDVEAEQKQEETATTLHPTQVARQTCIKKSKASQAPPNKQMIAAATAFALPKLLEKILLYLDDWKQPFVLLSVNTCFEQTTEDSLALQRKMWLAALPAVEANIEFMSLDPKDPCVHSKCYEIFDPLLYDLSGYTMDCPGMGVVAGRGEP